MRRFELYRYRDPCGVSGTGVVAIGLEFPPDHEGHQWIALKWLGLHPALTLWPSLYDLLKVHGHLGALTFAGWTRTRSKIPRTLRSATPLCRLLRITPTRGERNEQRSDCGAVWCSPPGVRA